MAKRGNKGGRSKFVPKGSVKEKLQSLDVRPNKSRGQNFIIYPAVVQSIVEFGAPKEGENLLEIGPGLGAMTEHLIKYGHLTVIEIEPQFCRDLAVRFPELKVINSDVRQVDLKDIGENLLVFGNLPYSFSTDIIFHLVKHRAQVSRAVLMLQREFAERMAASPGGKDYGVLSISCQLAAEVRLGTIISGDSFHPRTEVESRLVELTFHKTDRYKIPDVAFFKRVVSAAFMMRRKMIRNSLKAANILEIGDLDAALKEADIDPMARPETLSIDRFIALAQAIDMRRQK